MWVRSANQFIIKSLDYNILIQYSDYLGYKFVFTPCPVPSTGQV
jgi:hypothetical protein